MTCFVSTVIYLKLQLGPPTTGDIRELSSYRHRCAEGSTSSIVFVTWRQYTVMGGHISVSWRIRSNRPFAAAMRPYIKLLGPLVTFL